MRTTLATLKASTDQSIAEINTTLASLAEGQAQNQALMQQILATLNGGQPASTVVPVTPAPVKPAKVEKSYRSAAGKERAKAQVAALWTKTLADAGVKRAKDLTPAQMDAYRAQSKAIWAAVPKTRTTKA